MNASRRYRRPDTGEIAEAVMGLGGKWIVCVRKPNGSLRRVKSEYLPAGKSRDACQAGLDHYAAWKGWEEVNG